MKKVISLILISISFFFLSCDSIFAPEEPNELNGDTNTKIGEVGNTFTLGINVDGKYIPTNENCYVKDNDKGICTIHLEININEISANNKNIIPLIEEMIKFNPKITMDDSGNVAADFKVKITSEGLQDFFFSEKGNAFTLVKYNCEKGDEYIIEQSGGNKITRRVTEVSEEDTFQYGFWLIKIFRIEQDLGIPGVSKILYDANNKFGLVHVKFIFDDDSYFESFIFPEKY
ncbi:MAG: hypothetical protein A2X64_10235 [Ignavibacteria bacterium GWF2_33_9]|nr:MAG: hypothetical protein A2X64_10235 [Ignavibacteria bacterium GWF2_33_9]